MIRLLVLCCVLFGSAASAQQFPASYFVTGVAADDTLNIREQPDDSTPIVGEYDPYRLNIEVLETTPDGQWGRVGMGEGMGWVSMSFLTETLPVEPGTIPRPMACSGTEPFWSLTMESDANHYDTPDDLAEDMTMTSEQVAANGYMATFAQGPRSNRTLIIQRLSCSDGMSDRDFGFRATLFNTSNFGNSVQIGCCTLDSRN